MLWAWLLGWASAVAHPTDIVWLGRFDQPSNEWRSVQLDRRTPPTLYHPTQVEGVAAVEAKADRSMALYARSVEVDLAQTPVLCWRWRISTVVPGADLSRKQTDDQAARVYIGFDVPGLSAGMKTALALARMRFGQDTPAAALNYVWDTKAPVGTIVPNAYTSRARMVVMRSGNAQAGHWVEERRDVVEDMRTQFSTTQGRVRLVAVASDTDNTRQSVRAWFADVHMVKKDAPCQFPKPLP